MVFSNFEFMFLFLPLVLIFYYIIPKKYVRVRNLILLIASLIFYSIGELKYIIVMIITLAINYVGAIIIVYYKEKRLIYAKLVLVLDIVLSIGILAYFKYSKFICDNINLLISKFIKIDRISYPYPLVLPIGISFYTFQVVAYIIDVYKDKNNLQKNVIDFSLFVTFFPQLIAGPIVRYKDISKQIKERRSNVTLFSEGIKKFILGLTKKVFLADNAGVIWNFYKTMPNESRSMVGCWFGIICFSFQILFDFSGYSDMAIGLGKMFGFELPENFNYPYISRSIKEFFRRWHITLSMWFRDYIYIPLGGSRCKKIKIVRNLLIVWLLTGLWHGANVNFCVWGLYYFVLILIEKFVFSKDFDKEYKVLSRIYTMFCVVFGWFIFAYSDIDNGFGYLKKMFYAGEFINKCDLYEIKRNIVFIIILCICSTPIIKKAKQKVLKRFNNIGEVLISFGYIGMMVLSIAYICASTYSPFLYFRF